MAISPMISWGGHKRERRVSYSFALSNGLFLSRRKEGVNMVKAFAIAYGS